MLLKLSDSRSSKMFIGFNSEVCVEIGCHQGDIARAHKNKKVDYYGFEANPFNMDEYGLSDLGVVNCAVVSGEYDSGKVMLKIPLRAGKQSLTSGKSSILDRADQGWDKIESVEVDTIRVKEILCAAKIEKACSIKCWIDAEGISVTLAREFAQNNRVKFIYFECDMNSQSYKVELDHDIEFTKDWYVIKARTSHDQYNVMIFRDRPSLINRLLSLELMFYDAIVSVMFAVARNSVVNGFFNSDS